MQTRLAIVGLCLFILLTSCGLNSGAGFGDASGTVVDFTYNFDETPGFTAINSAGNGYYNGTIYGATKVSGKVGNALQFTNLGDRVQILVGTDWIHFTSDAISVGAWIYLDSIQPVGSSYHIFGDGSIGGMSFKFQINGGQVAFLLNEDKSLPGDR